MQHSYHPLLKIIEISNIYHTVIIFPLKINFYLSTGTFVN